MTRGFSPVKGNISPANKKYEINCSLVTKRPRTKRPPKPKAPAAEDHSNTDTDSDGDSDYGGKYYLNYYRAK